MSGLQGVTIAGRAPLQGGAIYNQPLPSVGPTPGFGGPGLKMLSSADPGVGNGIRLAALNGSPSALGIMGTAIHALGGGLGAIGTLVGQANRNALSGGVGVTALQNPFPTASVREGIPNYGGGTAGNITQNTSYSQPYTVNNNVQAPLVPMQAPGMMPDEVQRNAPLGMVPVSPLQGLAMQDFIAAGGQAPQQGVAQAIQQATQDNPNASSTPAQGAPGQMPQGPILRRDQGPQQPGPQQQIAAAPPQQAPAPVAAPAAPAPPPQGGQPPLLRGEEDYAQPSLSDRTAEMQGAPPRDEVAELKQKILEMQAALESQAAANKQPQAPAPSLMKKPNPFLMMMSPKLTNAYVATKAAEAKARAEAAQKHDDQAFQMAKQREHDEYERDTKLQEIELKNKLEKHMTAAQEMDWTAKFYEAPPGSDTRWQITSRIPSLRTEMDRPQDSKTASEYRIKAHEETIKGSEAVIAEEKKKYAKDDVFQESNKKRTDARNSDLTAQFNDKTFGDRVVQEYEKANQAAQETQKNALKNGLDIQNAALDAVAKVQSIQNHESDEYYKAFEAAERHRSGLVNDLSYMAQNDPRRPFVEAALMAMDTAQGKGTQETYKTKSGLTKTRTKIEGDNTMTGALMNQARTKTLQGGLQYQAPAAAPPQASPAVHMNNGLVPPPPAIAPSIVTPGGQVPFDLAAMVQNAATQFGPKGLAQAPSPVQIQAGPPQGPVGQPIQAPGAAPTQPGGYDPAFGQPRQELSPPLVQAQQPAPQAVPQPHPGAEKSDVERSLAAGQWVGAQEPTTAQQLEMLTHLVPEAFGKAVAEGAPKLLQDFNNKAWQAEKKQALNPFVTPESRKLPRGAELTDPELTKYFVLKSHTDQQKYEDLVKSAGWTPVKTPNGTPQPIADERIARQAWSHGSRDFLLTNEQRIKFQDEQDTRRKDRAFATTQGKAGFQLFKPAPPPSKLAGKKVTAYQSKD